MWTVISEFLRKFTNPLGSLTAISLTIAGFMEAVLGCKDNAATDTPLDATCAAPWLADLVPAEWFIYAGMFFGVLTFISKLGRPGGVGKSLFGSTAVVVPSDSSKAGPGTVTPAQVKAP